MGGRLLHLLKSMPSDDKALLTALAIRTTDPMLRVIAAADHGHDEEASFAKLQAIRDARSFAQPLSGPLYEACSLTTHRSDIHRPAALFAAALLLGDAMGRPAQDLASALFTLLIAAPVHGERFEDERLALAVAYAQAANRESVDAASAITVLALMLDRSPPDARCLELAIAIARSLRDLSDVERSLATASAPVGALLHIVRTRQPADPLQTAIASLISLLHRGG